MKSDHKLTEVMPGYAKGEPEGALCDPKELRDMMHD